MQTIASLLKTTEIPLLDAEILLAHVLQVSRTYLHSWPEKKLDESQYHSFFEMQQKRMAGKPVAYLIEKKEFWSLEFKVNQDVLIPRPETELLVEKILSSNEKEKIIADLGTGSGAIALAIAKERPGWIIHATDQSKAALKIAEHNAKKFQLNNIFFHQGNWCEALPLLKFDVIVSNPPYIAEDDTHLADLTFEPRSALVSANEGLKDIAEIIFQAKKYLKHEGKLILEHGFDQAEKVRELLQKESYTKIQTYKDLNQNDRATEAYC